MANAVLVIDMVKGFLEEGYPLYFARARRIIPAVKRLLAREQAAGSKTLYLCDNHDPDDLELRMFPRHCVAGTGETKVIPELARFPGEYIAKKRYSALYGSRLAARIRIQKPEKVIICGVCTDICVLHTAAGARDRDYNVEVPVNCMATFNVKAHRWALEHMEKVLRVRLVSA